MKFSNCAYKVGQGWINEFDSELDSERTLVLAFGSPHFAEDPKPFDELRAAFPKSFIAGCSTGGEILGPSLNDESVSVAVIQFEKTRLKFAAEEMCDGDDSYVVAMRLAKQLEADDLAAVLVLSDGIHVNGSELARGLSHSLGKKVPICGGLAGDGPRFKQTFVLDNGKPVRKKVAAIGFYGDALRSGYASGGGWSKFGHERFVTRSRGNILYEIDGRRALDVYKDYLGEKAGGLPATGLMFPLAIRRQGWTGEPVVRTILSVDENEGSLTFAGDIPEGSLAQFLYANLDRVIDGAADAARHARPDDDSPVFAVGISCVGRRWILNDRTEEEIEAVLEELPKHSQLIGFYSYGEISPIGMSGCDLHNQSMTLATFWEAA